MEEVSGISTIISETWRLDSSSSKAPWCIVEESLTAHGNTVVENSGRPGTHLIEFFGATEEDTVWSGNWQEY